MVDLGLTMSQAVSMQVVSVRRLSASQDPAI